MKLLGTLTFSVFMLLAANASSQLGPLRYLQESDSPWASNFGNGMFFLENFEDGALNTPGVTSTGASVLGPSVATDSVDGDDGTIDGLGRAGRSFFTGVNGAANGIRFTFSSGTYGALPTHAGLVWTDAAFANSATTRFEAFDGSGTSLGVITGQHADSNFQGSTREDRFYGWVHNGGIGSILMTNSGGGGLEVDHLQYGAVPEPVSMAAFGLGIAALASKRRKK